MADSTTVALPAAPLPSSDDLQRAARFTREPFVFEGEDLAVAMAPGSPRRRALDSALAGKAIAEKETNAFGCTIKRAGM